MKKWLLIGLIGIVSYAVFFIIQTPAEQAINRVAGGANAPIHVFDTQGTVFNGQAGSVYAGPFQIKQVTWSLSAIKAVFGQLGADLSGSLLGGKTSLTVNMPNLGSLNELSMSDIKSNADVEKLQRAFFAGRPPIRFGGDLSIDLKALDFSDKGTPANADGLVLWNNAVIFGQGPVPLGDFALSLTPISSGFKGKLQNVDDNGPLLVDVDINVLDNGAVTLNGTVKANAKAPTDIKQALAFKADQSGVVKLSTSFNLNDPASLARAKRDLL